MILAWFHIGSQLRLNVAFRTGDQRAISAFTKQPNFSALLGAIDPQSSAPIVSGMEPCPLLSRLFSRRGFQDSVVVSEEHSVLHLDLSLAQ
jgi:hypothetical protein